MIKVFFNAVSAKSGGAATYIWNLVEEIDEVDERFHFVFFLPQNFTKDLRANKKNISIICPMLPFNIPLVRFIWDQFLLRIILKVKKADIVVSTSDFGIFFSPCKQILMIRNNLFFSSLYIDSFLSKKKCMSKISFYLRRLLVIISIKSCDLILTASKSLLKDIKQTVKISDRNAVVNNFGVLLEKFNKNRQSSENIALLSDGRIIKLLYVSEYSDYKNLTTLLKALKLLNRDEKLKFLLTSTLDPMQFSKVDVASRDIDKKLLSDAEIANCIYCTGSIKYENIESLYKENDIFIFPSLVESFGYPLVEAMASGLPIVASDTPINREICEDAAVYFNATDSKDLTQKILEVSQNKELRNFLINAGLKRVRLCFDFKMHIKRMLDIFIMLSSEGKV